MPVPDEQYTRRQGQSDYAQAKENAKPARAAAIDKAWGKGDAARSVKQLNAEGDSKTNYANAMMRGDVDGTGIVSTVQALNRNDTSPQSSPDPKDRNSK